MKVPPNKPHFFKPIQPGFKNSLKIPIGFLEYLKGEDEEQEHAVLRRGRKKWQVKLKGGRLEDGWAEFAEEHDLQLGDLLVFRHEGSVEFEVTIFDSSQCGREYAEYLQEDDDDDEEEEEETSEKDESNRSEIVSPSKANLHSAEAATHDPSGQSHFEWTIRAYLLTKGYLRLPTRFARKNGLFDKKCALIIRDERQRSWNFKLNTSHGQVHMLGRWGEFRAANNLKLGDSIMFEVVTNGEKPIWKFFDKRNPSIVSSRKTSPDEESATHSPFVQSHFLFTVRPYCISQGFLRLTKQFAHANGLTKKKSLIIRDERQRSWDLRLVSYSSQVYIRGGWSEFHVANDLKVGDHIMFEVVTNGEQPIWKFHDLTNPKVKSSSKGLPYAEAATHKPFGQSHFLCIIKPYCLTYDFFYIPKEFVRENGLTNKKCDVIIRDEWKRSWNVKIRSFGSDVCIRVGWHEFRDANCLKEGDCVKFEVVSNRKKPIWRFSGKRSSIIHA